MSERLPLYLPGEALEAIAQRAAEIVATSTTTEPEPWVGVEEAARHLAAKPHRVYDLVRQERIPFKKDGSRLLFRLSELDAYLDGETW